MLAAKPFAMNRNLREVHLPESGDLPDSYIMLRCKIVVSLADAAK